MIVTGQQPAVGGGPLYTLIKIAHAVALAKQRGEPALFWCASEDHDLGEAGHADIVLRDGTIRRFTADLGGGRHSLAFRPAHPWWEPLVSWLHTQLGPGAGAAFLQAQAPQGEEGMGAWQCRLMRSLFPTLEAVEAHTLRARWAPALALALTQWPVAALAELRTRLLAAGAADAFGPLDEPPLFQDLATGRTAVDRPTAARLLAAGGLDLSPGAALRPLLQQAALPCSAYVGGPGELAYHRFITPGYAALRVTPPELIPRCSLTIVPRWCAQALHHLGTTPEQLSAWHAPQVAVDQRWTALVAALDAAIAGLTGEPGLSGSLRRLENERTHLVRRLARRAYQHQHLPAVGSLRAYLSPRGGRQERTMSLVQALWEHGPGLARVLVDAAAATSPGQHRYVLL